MAYLDKVLQPGEKILHRGTVSWTLYIPGLLLLILAIAVYVVVVRAMSQPIWSWIALALFGLPALYFLARTWFIRWVTEVAVTNQRIIFKRGFIQRHTIEMNMDKVESVDVEQSLLGRIFNFGDITVRGTGSGFEPLRRIDDPLHFRAQVSNV